VTKSRNYAGGSWFWLPDRSTTAADAHNGPWRIRNLFVNPQADGVFGILAQLYLLVLYLTFVMIIKRCFMDAAQDIIEQNK